MASRWLQVPLSDYEAHMNAAGVEQLAPLADLFRQTLLHLRPASVAILGIAGGNGLDAIDPAVTTRTVGVDIHPDYLAAVRRRYPQLPGLELHLHDLAAGPLPIPAVDLVHAALVFEHAGAGQCLESALALLAPSARLSVVLQLPSDSQAGVAPTGYASLQALKASFQLIPPASLIKSLAARGFALESESHCPLPSGKAFWHGIFRPAT